MPTPAPPELSLVEAIYSLRAMRRLSPEPVSEQDLRFLVDAATQAPSASNGQHWAFIVVTDAEQRRRLGEIYREVGRAVIRDQALASGRLPPETEKVYRNAMLLVEGMGSAPALIVVAARGHHPADAVQGGRLVRLAVPGRPEPDAGRALARPRHDAHHAAQAARGRGEGRARDSRRLGDGGADPGGPSARPLRARAARALRSR